LDLDAWRHGDAVAHPANQHPQVRTWPDTNPARTDQPDHRDGNDDDPHQPAERTGEQAFDHLNPDFGMPADHSNRIGHRDVAQREHALSLGVRVAVHDSRQNDLNPHVWQPGQD
jgi:hypothetical protein